MTTSLSFRALSIPSCSVTSKSLLSASFIYSILYLYICSLRLPTKSISLSLSVDLNITSWKCSSLFAISIRSIFSTAFLKSSIARSSSLISSSFIRSQASSMASSSSAFLTSSTSLRLLPVMPATSAPLLGIIITRPSSSSILIASLIGVLLTPRSFARRISTSLSPGERLPFNIACLKVLNTTSLSGI